MSYKPLTTNHFSVEWGGTRAGFTEVSGLSMEIEPIEYREGSFIENSSKKIPGIRKYSNITLKRGIIKSDNDMYNWFNTVSGNTIEKRDLTISLLNENHEPVITWKLKDAFPIKIEWSDLKANANEVAIESIEIAHEGLVVLND